MTKVTSETMRPKHVKAARALLEWSAEELADVLPVGVATLRTFESGKEVKLASRIAIFDGLTNYGVRMQNGGRPGVKIVEPEKWSININKKACPACDSVLPFIRTPRNLRQVVWGGWTCENCRAEIDKAGREIA